MRRALLTVALAASIGLVSCYWESPVSDATRADVMVALLDVETTLADLPAPLVGEYLRFANQQFDYATREFSSGDASGGAIAFRQLASWLRYGPSTTLDLRFAESLRVRVEPFTYVVGDAPPIVEVVAISRPSVDDNQPVQLTLRAVNDYGAQAWTVDVTTDDASMLFNQRIAVALDAPPVPGTYRVEFVTPAGRVVPAATWRVSERSLDEIRAENAQRLSALAPTSEKLIEALAIASARNALLADAPPETQTSAYLADPATLAVDVAREVDRLAAGVDPYERRAGDYWRVLSTRDGDVPMRVYAPAQTLTDAPAPLVVALHGLGGDETLYFEGYGRGAIKTLADENGFIVVAPFTGPYLLHPEYLPQLLDSLSDDYAIDRSRIYFVGHSLGAITAVNLAVLHPDVAQRIALFAGGQNLAAGDALPPTLMYAAEYDPVLAGRGLDAVVAIAQQKGLPVEFRMLPDYGHTLGVGDTLPEAIDWLLADE